MNLGKFSFAFFGAKFLSTKKKKKKIMNDLVVVKHLASSQLNIPSHWLAQWTLDLEVNRKLIIPDIKP